MTSRPFKHSPLLAVLFQFFMFLCWRRQRIVKSLICSCILIGSFLYVASAVAHRLFYSIQYFGKNIFDDRGGIIDLSNNYFSKGGVHLNQDFLVNTEKCRIPKLDIWSEDWMRQPFEDNSEYNCSGKDLKITFVEDAKIIINISALETLGHSLRTVSCCYRAIFRVEEPFKYNDQYADRRFQYSRECTKMTITTQPTHRHIKVICHSRLLSIPSYSYINFHAIPLLRQVGKLDITTRMYENAIMEKIRFWSECKKPGKYEGRVMQRFCKTANGPAISLSSPNILFIGIDSVSRMNFRRLLKKSVRSLEAIGAIEMQGYTKVGPQTLPNFLALMTSHSLNEIRKTCFTSNSDPFDDCPFIWKNFSQQNYLTALMEDSPEIAIFNYHKTGFVKQPTDIYNRPLMLSMYEYLGNKYTMSCMKYQRPEEMILNFATDLGASAAKTGLPFFIATWLTDLSHDHMHSLEMMDDLLSQTIEKLRQRELLENTLLLVISDHGYRFLPIRKTLSGYYEDKLPALWIHVPESIRKMMVGSKENVAKNSRNLISPYDVHATLKHILAMNVRESIEEEVFRVGKGISLFSEMPDRSCEESGIPQEHCACDELIPFEDDHEIIRTAANAAVVRINEEFNSTEACYLLRVSHVFSSGVIRRRSSSSAHKGYVAPTNSISLSDVLLIGFVATPGDMSIESRIGFDPATRDFTKVIGFMRTNKIQVTPLCIYGSKNFVILEELCVCRL